VFQWSLTWILFRHDQFLQKRPRFPVPSFIPSGAPNRNYFRDAMNWLLKAQTIMNATLLHLRDDCRYLVEIGYTSKCHPDIFADAPTGQDGALAGLLTQLPMEFL
jgi:hypothetical protein